MNIVKNICSCILIVAISAFATIHITTFIRDYNFTSQSDRDIYSAAREKTGEEVIMYATSWCRYCMEARAFLDKHEVPYAELDIEKDSEAREQFEQLEGKGTPLILVDNDLVRGFDQNKLSRLLSIEH